MAARRWVGLYAVLVAGCGDVGPAATGTQPQSLAEAPVPADEAQIERLSRAMEDELAGIDAAEDRWALRQSRYVEARARLDESSLDGPPSMSAQAMLRDRFIGTDEALADFDEYERAHVRREGLRGPTPEDIENARIVMEADSVADVMEAQRATLRATHASDVERSQLGSSNGAGAIDTTNLMEDGDYSRFGEEQEHAR